MSQLYLSCEGDRYERLKETVWHLICVNRGCRPLVTGNAFCRMNPSPSRLANNKQNPCRSSPSNSQTNKNACGGLSKRTAGSRFRNAFGQSTAFYQRLHGSRRQETNHVRACAISGKPNSEHAGMNSRNEQNPAVDLRVTTTLSQVVDVLNAQGARYALIGGLGVALRGNVRATQDVDILMHIVQLRLPSLLEAMCDCGCQLDVAAAIREWNDGGLLAIQWPGNVQVDLLKPVIPVFDRIIDRASDESFNEQIVRVADAESLLLLKLLAFRPLDQEDIRGILTKNTGGLDLHWVRKEANEAGLDQQRRNAFEQLVQDFYVT